MIEQRLGVTQLKMPLARSAVQSLTQPKGEDLMKNMETHQGVKEAMKAITKKFDELMVGEG